MLGLSYWIIPVFSALVWITMLAAMIGKWLADGSPHYPSMSPDQHIAYISDVGAAAPYPNRSGLKPLFIAMSSTTVVILDIAFLADRWLRHRRRLVPNTSTSEKVLSVLATIFAILGAAGIILLSIFDTYNYPHAHDGFLLLFIGGYIISAIFICAEYQRLGIHQRQYLHLRASFWIKLSFIIIEAALAIAFIVTNFRGNKNVAAILEWVVAVIFTGWILSFVIDLWPARKTGRRHGGGKFGGPEENGTSEYPGTAHTDPAYSARYSGATLPSEQQGVMSESAYHGDGSRTNYSGYRGAGRASPGPAQTMSSSATPNATMNSAASKTWVDQRDGNHHGTGVAY